MKNKIYLKRYLIMIISLMSIFTIIFTLISMIEYHTYQYQYNLKINGLISEISKQHPDLNLDELVGILNENQEVDNILSEYGYDLKDDSFISSNDELYHQFMLMKVSGLLVLIILVIIVVYRYGLKHDDEIETIIKCIEEINQKNYELAIDSLSEDKLSILKQEIYKTTLMLKETADNSLMDKIKLKNALQDISHQLKTPLTSINIMLDNMLDDELMDDATRMKFLRQMKRELANMTFLIQNILKLSKFETNTITYHASLVKVSDLINGVILKLANLSDLKAVKIKVVDKTTRELNCDYKWQEEALSNIVKNALEYANEGSDVLISCEDNQLYTQIKISNLGKMISKAELKNIFKRFYNGKNAHQDSVGIGLALAKTIIENDNGVISVDSNQHQTTFIIKYYNKGMNNQ